MIVNSNFIDLSIIKKRNKLKKQQISDFLSSDIKNGFVHINGEKIKFSEKLVLENTLKIQIPVSFYKGILSNEFSNVIFSNFDSSVFIEFTVLFSDIEQKNFKPLQSEVLNHMKEKSKSVILSEGKILTDENKEINYSELLIKNEENDRYYLLCFFEKAHYFILGIFCCLEYRLEDWKDVFFQMVQTIKI